MCTGCATLGSWILFCCGSLGTWSGTHASVIQRERREIFIHQLFQSRGEGCSRGSLMPLHFPEPRRPWGDQEIAASTAVCGVWWESVCGVGWTQKLHPSIGAWVSDQRGGPHSCVCVRTQGRVL